MLTKRRQFLQRFGVATATGLIAPSLLRFDSLHAEAAKEASLRIAHLSPEEAATDEEYWKSIQLAYSVSPAIINLNNGGVSPQPILTQNMQDKYVRMCNEVPSYSMWQLLDQGREPLREKLALLAGCSPEEIAINRNSTEALETIIFGLNIKEGEEVVLCKQDYPNMFNAWKLREKRNGVKLIWVDLNLPKEDDEYFVKVYSDAVTSKTKIVHLTHCINWDGQFIPVRKISDAVKKKNPNVEVICDIAHSFCHIDFKIPDLNVEYAGTSLHKWMCAPFGSGMLYVKKEKIKSLWPLFANDEPDKDDIRKFESLGTRSFPIEQAIGYSLDFHNDIGTARKEARLRYLKDYWTNQVKDIPKVSIHTPMKKEYSCGIGTFYIEGEEVKDISKKLFDKYKIHITTIDYNHAGKSLEKETAFPFKHIRVSPNVYTKLSDLDKLVKAIKDMAVNGTKS